MVRVLDRDDVRRLVGSDMPHKQELDPQVLVAAGKYVPDSIAAAAASGELHHALEAGLLEVGSVYGELTAVASGRLAGRTAGDELTVADLTGVGIQGAAVAALAARLAGEHAAGAAELQRLVDLLAQRKQLAHREERETTHG